jgi:hypothetical protein
VYQTNKRADPTASAVIIPVRADLPLSTFTHEQFSLRRSVFFHLPQASDPHDQSAFAHKAEGL